MDFSEAIKKIRQDCFLSQESFAKELGVSSSTVLRWEKGQTIPNCVTMRKIVSFCKKQNVSFQQAEEAWKENRNGIHSC